MKRFRHLLPAAALLLARWNSAGAGGAEGEVDLRDIRPPVHIPELWKWLLAALLLAIAAAGFWLWWRRRRNTAPFQPPPIPPQAVARAQLEAALRLLADPKPFCTAVSDAVRCYLEAQFQWHAPERTTEEFLEEIRENAVLSPELKETLGQFLSACDLVKFARLEPSEFELRELHAAALRVIDETVPAPAPALP